VRLAAASGEPDTQYARREHDQIFLVAIVSPGLHVSGVRRRFAWLLGFQARLIEQKRALAGLTASSVRFSA
jgi:hypothetical protein